MTTLEQEQGPLADLRVIDADTHFSEPYDLWTSRAPAKYRDQVPQVREDSTGRLRWFLGNSVLFNAGGASFVNRDAEKIPLHSVDITSGVHWEEIHEASYDARARVALLEDMGIWAQVVYPNTLGFAAGALVQQLDRDLSAAIVAMYNDAVAEWQNEVPGRLFPQALLPFWDIPAAVKEAARIKDLGLTGITMAGEPQLGGLPDLGQPDWDPLYEVLTDLKLPINIHVGATNIEVHHDEVGWASLEQRARKPVKSVQMELANSRFMSNLVLSDVLLRWPELRWVSVESGIGWIPYVLERVDYEYREQFPGVGEPTRPPAHEMFRRNIYACFWFEEAGPQRLLDDLGVDNVMWESDFPHPTCLYPDPVGRTLESLRSLDPTAVRKVMQDNAAHLYGIPLPS